MYTVLHCYTLFCTLYQIICRVSVLQYKLFHRVLVIRVPYFVLFKAYWVLRTTHCMMHVDFTILRVELTLLNVNAFNINI